MSMPALYWLFIHVKQFDIVHVHAGRDLWVMLAMSICRMRHVPYVWQTHGMLNVRASPFIKLYDRVLVRGAMNAAKCMMYLTPYERRALEAFKVPVSMKQVINGVDEPAIGQRSPASGLRLVFCARLHERKRAIDLVDAVICLIAEDRDFVLDIYGPDEGALQEIQKSIRVAGVSEKIRYRGALAYEDVRHTLAGYECMVLPSINEPFPNSILEAMASGLAVVITSSCGLAPYISNAKAGLIVDPGVEGIIKALRSLDEGGPSLVSELGDRAFELARDVFSMDAVAVQLMESYS